MHLEADAEQHIFLSGYTSEPKSNLFGFRIGGTEIDMEYKIFDAHCDTLCKLNDLGGSAEENDFHIDIKRMSKYKKYTQVFACFIAPEYRSCAFERFAELADTFYESIPNGILSIEGGNMISSLKMLRTLSRLGVRIAALTWNYSNHIASGVNEPDKTRGLTQFGKKVILEMNRLNMLIDYSHLNDRSFYDIAEISKLPIVATHSSSRAVCAHPRNLTDEQFGMIIKTGGCAGINIYPPFLKESGDADIDDIVKHIEHFMSMGGGKNIGLGADFDGVDCLPRGIRGCEDLYKIPERLLQMNYPECVVEDITYNNFDRIFNGGKNNA